MKKQILSLAVLPLSFGTFFGFEDSQNFTSPIQGDYLLSVREISLGDRYENSFVNEVFKENILLNLAYLEGKVTKLSDINWEEITKPFIFSFRLNPNETFAYHDDIKEKYKQTLVKTTNAHFNAAEGFKTDGYLFGDGVCHLASLIFWAAKDANLEAEAPRNHDFTTIPGIPREFGVSIYSNPYSKGSYALQNLYITNNRQKPISFKFEYADNKIKVSIIQLN